MILHQSIEDKTRISLSRKVSKVSTFDTFATLLRTEFKSSVILLQALMGCEVLYGMQLLENHSIIRYHQHICSNDDPCLKE